MIVAIAVELMKGENDFCKGSLHYDEFQQNDSDEYIRITVQTSVRVGMVGMLNSATSWKICVNTEFQIKSCWDKIGNE